MAEYTKRTCYKCGKRDIQPNMNQIVIEYDAGSSQSSITGATLLGALFEHKPSQRAIGRTLFNSSKRNYKRKKKVWACNQCKRQQPNNGIGDVLIAFGAIFFFLMVILGMISN